MRTHLNQGQQTLSPIRWTWLSTALVASVAGSLACGSDGDTGTDLGEFAGFSSTPGGSRSNGMQQPATQPSPTQSAGNVSTTTCSDTCRWAFDGECDDGSAGSDTSACDPGTDCGDCGSSGFDDSPPPSTPAAPSAVCSDTCRWAFDGECDDGGPGSDTSVCDPGTDCGDCGSSGFDDSPGVPIDQPSPGAGNSGGAPALSQFENVGIKIVEDRVTVIRNVSLEICEQGVVALSEAEVQDGITQSTTQAFSIGRVTSVSNSGSDTLIVAQFTISNPSGRGPFEGRFTITTDSTGTPTRMISSTSPGIGGSVGTAVIAPVAGLFDTSEDCALAVAQF